MGLSAVTTTARHAAFSFSSTAVARTCAARAVPMPRFEPAEQESRNRIGRLLLTGGGATVRSIPVIATLA
jgi:hypothetical protein